MLLLVPCAAYFSSSLVAITQAADPSFWIGRSYEIAGAGTGGSSGSGSTGVLGATGLPFYDDFERTLSNWPESPSTITISSIRANSGSSSAAGNQVNGSLYSQWLNRAWGDARSTCTACYSCDPVSECPGGRTPEIWVKVHVYVEGTSLGANNGRKLLQLGIFDDWNANYGDSNSNLRHMVTYTSLFYGDWDGDGKSDDFAFDSPRRDDNQGNRIANVWNSKRVNDVFLPSQWNEIVLHVKTNTPGVSDGLLDVWLNGSRVIQSSSQNWFGGYSGGQTWNMLLLTDNGNGPPAPGTTRVFWDDVAISTSTLSPGSSPGPSPAQALTGGTL